MDGWRGARLQGQAGEDPRHQVHQGLENSLSLPKIAMSVHDELVTTSVFGRQKTEPQRNLKSKCCKFSLYDWKFIL